MLCCFDFFMIFILITYSIFVCDFLQFLIRRSKYFPLILDWDKTFLRVAFSDNRLPVVWYAFKSSQTINNNLQPIMDWMISLSSMVSISYWHLSRVNLLLLTSFDPSFDNVGISHISFPLVITWSLDFLSLEKVHIKICLALEFK